MIRHFKEQLTTIQLSRSQNISLCTSNASAGAVLGSTGAHEGAGAVANRSANVCGTVSTNYQLKSDIFDGTVLFPKFMTQFTLIAQASGWSDAMKAIALAVCFRGKARAVLDVSEDEGEFGFAELKEKLELRFEGRESAHNYYMQFAN